MTVTLSPADRFAIVGKTGSGKTHFTVVLASMLVPADSEDWECWWLDSKLDPRDGRMLREWGFGRTPARKIVKLHPQNGPVDAQAQAVCLAALDHRNILVVCDEYKHVTRNQVHAGEGIEGVHLRGRGLNVGMAGQTQEPTYVPRQLISQASHIFLFDLTYPGDIKRARELYEGYQRPEDSHGFYHAHIDGDAQWRYYPHVRAFHDAIVSPDTMTKQTA